MATIQLLLRRTLVLQQYLQQAGNVLRNAVKIAAKVTI